VLNVACACDDTCSFIQGDIPFKVSADNWYKHFQCSEPCFDAITQTGTGTQVPVENNPVTGANG
jgi:hypothetical protein